MALKNTCFKCEKRTTGCHSVCKDYIDAVAEWQKEKAEIQKIKKAKADSNDFRSANVQKALKHKRRY